MMNAIPTKSEIEACQVTVQGFRVNELHQLLTEFNYPKIGKKSDLVSRAITILNNPKFQQQAVKKVRELQANIRVRDTNQSYTTTANSGSGTINVNNQQSQHPHQMNPLNMSAGLQVALSNLLHHGAGVHLGYHPVPLLNQQHQQQVVPLQPQPTSTNGNVANLRIVGLPFYDFIKPIIQMTELPASYPMPTRSGESRFSTEFGILPEDIKKLNYPDDKELPRYEIQLRVFRLETPAEQQDAFPPNTTVCLDDAVVTLPPVIPTNKPDAEQKRYPRPVNLTPYCRPPHDRKRPHRLSFEWKDDKRAWAFSVSLVLRVDTEILLDRLRKNPHATRPIDTTKTAIIRRLNGEYEDDVQIEQMDSLKISLIDPLSKTRICIPARSEDCTHLQTFDLKNYLMMNEKRPGWTCPICNRNAIYSKLIIDEYFEHMLLETVGQSIEEVELLRDGTWHLPKTVNTVSLDSDGEAEEGQLQQRMAIDDEDDIIIIEKAAKKPRMEQKQETGTVGNAAKEQQQKETDMDIDGICLSSDDEEEQLAPGVVTPPNNKVPAIKRGKNGVIVQSQQCKSPTPKRACTGQQNSIGQDKTNMGSIQNGGPTIDELEELEKTEAAKHLALFLENVYTKINQMNMQGNGTPNHPR